MNRPRTLALLACLSVVSAAVADDGFVALFDGASLDGWVQRGGEATYAVDATAEGGPQIVGTSVSDTPNSFLCTDRDYGDFVLEFDVKVDPSLNSGVQFRSRCHDTKTVVTLPNPEGGTKKYKIAAGRVHGYQAEIDPSDRAWSGGVYDEARRGWLYNLEGDDRAEARGAFDPSGWNHYRVEAIGDSIKTTVNGTPVADFTDSVTPSGFIALQVHAIKTSDLAGKQIRWRNLQIKEIE